MKKVTILGIAAIAIIANFAISDIACAVNVKKEVAKIRQLEKEGKKAEAEERANELWREVDRLFKEGKTEESNKLYNELWIELSRTEQINKQ